MADDTINWNSDRQSSSSDQSPQPGVGNTETDNLESGPTGAETRLRGRRRNRSLVIFMFVLIVFHVIFIVIAISFWKMWDVPFYPEVVL